MRDQSVLDIRKNPINCSSQLCWIFDPCSPLEIKADKFPCHSPDSMKQVGWNDINPARLHCGEPFYNSSIVFSYFDTYSLLFSCGVGSVKLFITLYTTFICFRQSQFVGCEKTTSMLQLPSPQKRSQIWTVCVSSKYYIIWNYYSVCSEMHYLWHIIVGNLWQDMCWLNCQQNCLTSSSKLMGKNHGWRLRQIQWCRWGWTARHLCDSDAQLTLSCWTVTLRLTISWGW